MLLERRSGDPDKPRILGAFNQPVKNWLDFFMFTMFTDRDGKYQLLALAESAFDPLSRTCQFMLTEEAHHMFVGDTGIGRVIRRTIEVMNELRSDDPEAVRKAGAVDLPTLQRYMNFWFSSALDLFGADQSSNAASYFATGLKGRPDETRYADHLERDTSIELDRPGAEGKPTIESVPTRSAMNEIARRAYMADCEVGLKRWNRLLQKAGVDFQLKLPSPRFRRSIGSWAGFHTTPEGEPISAEAWNSRKAEFVPSEQDKAYVRSLMVQVTEPGKMAGWIAPPDRGINNLPVTYEYVKLS